MAEYIDREKVCENCNNKNYCEKEKCPVYKVSTADVVPKSEVEELKKDRYQVLPDGRLELLPRSDVKALKKEVEMLQGALKAEERHNELTMEMAQKALQNAKAEVAREIFEEIERLCDAHLYWNNCSIIQRDDIAELKKKYTEEQS